MKRFLSFFKKLGDLISSLDKLISFVTRKIKHFIFKLFRIVFFIMALSFIIVQLYSLFQPTIKNNSVLNIPLKGNITDQNSNLTFRQFIYDDQNNMSIRDIKSVLKYAANDDHITALTIETDGVQIGYAVLDELIVALDSFKQSGKKVIVYLNQAGIKQYMIASVADEIIMNPFGVLDLSGWSVYRFYFKSFLDRIKFKSFGFIAGDFKSGPEPFLRDSMSKNAKLNIEMFANELWHLSLGVISKNRGISYENLQEFSNNQYQTLIKNQGDHLKGLLDSHLVDHAMTVSEYRSYLKRQFIDLKDNSEFHQVNYDIYKKLLPGLSNNSKNVVAVLNASGTIVMGNQVDELNGRAFAKLIRKVGKRDDVKALVLRVDSPGGSVVASDYIRDELLHVKQKGVPIVVSMGNVAASGGYWISTPADKIIASPFTITGSIGVYGLLVTVEDALNNLGIYSDGVGLQSYSESSIERGIKQETIDTVQTSISFIYNYFLNLVSESRNMSIENVKKVAQGKVWMGSQAYQQNLIDGLGGIDQAIDIAANFANLDDDFTVEYISESKSPLEKFFDGDFKLHLSSIFSRLLISDFTLFEESLKSMQSFMTMNDPNHMYIHCFECEY